MAGRVETTAGSDLVDAARAGNRRALASLISVVERGGEAARSLAPLVHLENPNAFTIGLTGAPGAGFGTCGEGYFRLSAFGIRENVVEAVERIKKVL